MDSLDKLGVQHDLGVENFGDWAVLLGVSRHIGEFCFVEVGHFSSQRQSRTANAKSLALWFESDRRLWSRWPASGRGAALSDVTASTGAPLAVIRGYEDLHRALRVQADRLNLSRLVIDEAAGLTRGHASKLLAPVPIKRATLETTFFLAPALGLRLALIEDAEALALI
jgi:hypothetical protein